MPGSITVSIEVLSGFFVGAIAALAGAIKFLRNGNEANNGNGRKPSGLAKDNKTQLEKLKETMLSKETHQLLCERNLAILAQDLGKEVNKIVVELRKEMVVKLDRIFEILDEEGRDERG